MRQTLIDEIEEVLREEHLSGSLDFKKMAFRIAMLVSIKRKKEVKK